jgi:hypothetical protein
LSLWYFSACTGPSVIRRSRPGAHVGHLPRLLETRGRLLWSSSRLSSGDDLKSWLHTTFHRLTSRSYGVLSRTSLITRLLRKVACLILIIELLLLPVTGRRLSATYALLAICIPCRPMASMTCLRLGVSLCVDFSETRVFLSKRRGKSFSVTYNRRLSDMEGSR